MLEVGMWVRTVSDVYYKGALREQKGEILEADEWTITNSIYSTKEVQDVLKFSHNIIDLIEVGDYVNGEKVYKVIATSNIGDKAVVFKDGTSTFRIKSVLTKEQFEKYATKVVQDND